MPPRQLLQGSRKLLYYHPQKATKWQIRVFFSPWASCSGPKSGTNSRTKRPRVPPPRHGSVIPSLFRLRIEGGALSNGQIPCHSLNLLLNCGSDQIGTIVAEFLANW